VKRSLIPVVASLALAAAILVVPFASPAEAKIVGTCASESGRPNQYPYLITGYGAVTVCVQRAFNARRPIYLNLVNGQITPLAGYSPRDPDGQNCCVRAVLATDGVVAHVAHAGGLVTGLGKLWWGIQYRTRNPGPNASYEGRAGAVDQHGLFNPIGGWLPLGWQKQQPLLPA
jgi:hypothetical protein